MSERLADVALPVPLPQLFTYSIPASLVPLIERGSAVVVPFGHKVLTGIVTGFPSARPGIAIKAISDIADLQPMLGEEELRLASWISDYYQAPIGETMRLFLPPGFGHISTRFVTLADGIGSAVPRPATQQRIIEVLTGGPLPIAKLRTITGNRNLGPVLRTMTDAGIIMISERIPKRTALKRTWFFQRISTEAAPILKGKKQTEIWERILSMAPAEYEAAAFIRTHGSSLATLRTLEGKGLLTMMQKESKSTDHRRTPDQVSKDLAIRLNPGQQHCVDAITEGLDKRKAKTFLLHGITGSGKTQVYIETIREALAQKRSCIVLIPEISLTPQTVGRFRSHFGDSVIWMHSRMSDGERQEAWRSARAGTHPIVIGPRSALFAPLKDIGLIIVDEEHESSYKQFDATPRYHARDAAIVRASLHNAVVVLGSATPSIESFANAEQGRYTLLSLPERADNAVLPPVTIVNMVDVRKSAFTAAKLRAKEQGKTAFDNLSRSISPVLEQKIRERLERKEGIILLQNRRGFAPFIECSSCGHVEQCDHCSVTMTYHATKKHLRCHYCGSVKQPPTSCAKCGGFAFTMNGYGTQRVEEELHGLFPEATVARMDMDSTSRKGSHERILREFGEGRTDILLGTQMVAKGLDFARVTLVGVISADTQMMLPDFRSAERTFQLLTQVAGRAGRSVLAGEVIIQTSQPGHYALKFVQEHDFIGFYREEIAFRSSVNYPPYSRIIVLEFKGKDASAVEQCALEAGKKFASLLPREAVLGPSPAVLAKIKNDHRWQIILKSDKATDQNGTRARQAAARVIAELSKAAEQRAVKLIIDVDPSGIL